MVQAYNFTQTFAGFSSELEKLGGFDRVNKEGELEVVLYTSLPENMFSVFKYLHENAYEKVYNTPDGYQWGFGLLGDETGTEFPVVYIYPGDEDVY